VVSAVTYQRRGPGPAPAPWFPDESTRDAVGELTGIARRLSRSQRSAGLPETPDPDAGFVAAAHAWALGIDLEQLLEEEDVTGGDFVRHMRQLVDLLRQIGDVAPDHTTRVHARSAMKALDRGLVAAATRVSDGTGLANAEGGSGPSEAGTTEESGLEEDMGTDGEIAP
jgi:ATP-dependent RNA helicase HelY